MQAIMLEKYVINRRSMTLRFPVSIYSILSTYVDISELVGWAIEATRYRTP